MKGNPANLPQFKYMLSYFLLFLALIYGVFGDCVPYQGSISQAGNESASRIIIQGAIDVVSVCVAEGLTNGGDSNTVRTPSGESALMTTAATNDAESLRTLLDAGAAVAVTDAASRTALHYAALGNGSFTAPLLLKAGAPLTARDSTGASPLHLAAANDSRIAALHVLVDAHAPLDAVDDAGYTPLHTAAAAPAPAAAAALVTAGAATGAADKTGATPLHAAAKVGSVAVITLLVDAGAVVDAVGGDGRTPLATAAAAGTADAVEVLVKAGADVNHTDGAGQTPLHITASTTSLTTLNLLLHAGANVCAQDAAGHFAYDYAAAGSLVQQRLSELSLVCNIGCPAGQHGNAVNHVCALCPAGALCPAASAAPTPCPAGTYQPKTGGTECLKDCAAGSYVVDAAGVAAKSGAVACTACPAGHRCASLTAEPDACPAGEFQPKTGQTECTPCGVGSYTTNGAGDALSGATGCTACEAGAKCPGKGVREACTGNLYQGSPAATECQTCDPGHYVVAKGARDDENTACYKCAVGTYALIVGPQCVKCETGKFQDEMGQSSCKTTCIPGHYASDGAGVFVPAGATACTVCPIGHQCGSAAQPPALCTGLEYSDVEGLSACKTCSLGNRIVASSSGNSDCIACEAGTRGDVGGICTPCPAGTHSAASGAVTCDQCPEWTYSAAAGHATCTACPVDHTQLYVHTSTLCAYCPDESYLSEGTCRRCQALVAADPVVCARTTDTAGATYSVLAKCGEGSYRASSYVCRGCRADERCPGGGVTPVWHYIVTFNMGTTSGIITLTLLIIIIVGIGAGFLAWNLWKRSRASRYQRIFDERDSDEPIKSST